jgi:phosphoribosylformylglycinamidine synthase
MKFGVVVFPGSNCDEDMLYTLTKVMQQEAVKLWHKDHDLQNCDCIILPGGFSYGDYLRTGAIARFSPIMDEVISFAQQGGLLLGICNGFQILAEAGLVPGILLRNANQKYSCKNIYLNPANTNTKLTTGLETAKAYKIPIAHGEGRYYAKPEVIAQLHSNQQIIFRYCDENGQITEQANPNGSIDNIAGVCNATKNVFGMMPHPERAADKMLGNTDGKFILDALIAKSV